MPNFTEDYRNDNLLHRCKENKTKTNNTRNDQHSLNWNKFIYLNSAIASFIDTIYFTLLQTGGLYDFSRVESAISCQYRNKHTFSVSRSKSFKGVEVSMWEIPQWQRPNDKIKSQLIVFNTHLDPWNDKNRKKQIDEILTFIESTLRLIEKQGQNQQYDWSHTGVLLLGDFNIKADSDEYNDTFMPLSSASRRNTYTISRTLNIRSCKRQIDVVLNDFFSGYCDSPKDHTYNIDNSLVEYPGDCGRIDYIFGIDCFGSKIPGVVDGELDLNDSNSYRNFMKLDIIHRSIQSQPIGSESSDHYALIVDLIPKKNRRDNAY